MKGEKIKDIRNLIRLTQEEMAKEIGITRDRLANYETGRSEPDEETWRKILDLERNWDLFMADLEQDFPSLKYIVKALREEKYETALGAIRDLIAEIEKKRPKSPLAIFPPSPNCLN
jgi:transcriptional regulator with XRE-family HTH domain